MLRILTDREKVGGAMVGYLCSRLRAMEVNDPAHILWRICLLAIDASGLKGVLLDKSHRRSFLFFQALSCFSIVKTRGSDNIK